MSVIDRSAILRFVFRRERHVPRAVARRWQRAVQDEPALAEDLIRLSGILAQRSEVLEAGEIRPDPIDPVRLAYEQGQQDFAKTLLALMHLTPFELNQLIGDADV